VCASISSTQTHFFFSVCWCYHQHSLSNTKEVIYHLWPSKGLMCAPLFYTTHPPTANCWWVGSNRVEASTHKSVGGPQCPENYSAHNPHPLPPPSCKKNNEFRTLFPYKHFVTRKAWSFQPQTLGAGFGRNSGTRAPTPSAFILFRPPSRQRAKLAMLFYRAAAAALAPSSWRATMPRIFFGHALPAKARTRTTTERRRHTHICAMHK